MHPGTPKEITKHIRQLVSRIAPEQAPVYLPVQPEADAKVNECFPNVEAKISRAGGSMLCGWQIWELPHVLVEAEFHAVWLAPDGTLTEISPKKHGEERILFVPQPGLAYEGLAKDNIRMAVRDDLLVHHFIRVSEEIVKVLNRGERAEQYGHVSVPADEIEPLLNAQEFLGKSIATGLRDHSACLCGNGRKYKQCHGRGFPW